MKKVVVIGLVACALFGLGWRYKRTLFFYYWSLRNPPEELRFVQYEKGRIEIQYVNSVYLYRNIESIANRLDQNLKQAERVTGTRLDHLQVHIYNDYEEKGADVQDIPVAHADPAKDTIYCIVNDTLDGTRERLEYELLLRKCCGKPVGSDRGRIAAAALAGVWNQKSLEDWRAFLTERKLGPAAEDAMTVSQFIRIPWNALYMSALLKSDGWSAFAGYYGNAPADADSLRAKLAFAPGPDPPPLAHPPEFQKGISYAYMNGYAQGYPTKQSAASLDELHKLGVRWVAAIPYGFMRGANALSVRGVGHSIFTESDEAMSALTADAHKRGMKIMLKPQIWVQGGWPGMVNFPDSASAGKWFESYGNWMIHYAILAELNHIDFFCIGTELVKTTLQWPDEWRALIARIRQVYHGPLVYAANYGEEFEKMQFWDALDYMGLDNYYAVRNSTTDSLPVVKAAFAKQKERIHAVVQQWNKPLIFTEIGYHANPGAGMGSREDGIKGYDETMQAACYKAALETYWNEPWFYGMYWWKWFSTPEDRGRNADEHSPHGRMAEKVIGDWYNRTDRR